MKWISRATYALACILVAMDCIRDASEMSYEGGIILPFFALVVAFCWMLQALWVLRDGVE